jgi:hypothetical protein
MPDETTESPPNYRETLLLVAEAQEVEAKALRTLADVLDQRVAHWRRVATLELPILVAGEVSATNAVLAELEVYMRDAVSTASDYKLDATDLCGKARAAELANHGTLPPGVLALAVRTGFLVKTPGAFPDAGLAAAPPNEE